MMTYNLEKLGLSAIPSRHTTSALAVVLLTLIAFPLVAAPQSPEPAPNVSSAVDGVLDLFKQKSVVALGDAHGLAQQDAFYSALVGDPRFAEQVGNVVVEFGGESAQSIIDRYVAGEDVPIQELRRVWNDVVGWSPGETSILGFVNFYASVRAANLKLPPEKRIKVWLGDPKVDWSQVHSFQDLRPLLRTRDDNFFRIISDEILKKHKKTLLIIGLGHLLGPGPGGTGGLTLMFNKTYPGTFAIVSPFLGYIEPECNAKFVALVKDWPVPAVASPIAGTSLKSDLQLSGCNYVSPERVDRIKKMAASGQRPDGIRMGPGGPTQTGGGAHSPLDMLAANINLLSGISSDALLYLGPPSTLMQSPLDPSVYLDLDYFKELENRVKLFGPFGSSLNWDHRLQENLGPKKFAVPR
jgi:hypothetical protein